MNEKPWLDDITEDEMPNEELKIIASLCGVETAISLMKNVPGFMICVPNRALINLRNKYICNNYDGTKKSILQLSQKLGLSVRHIYLILNKNMHKD
ncbi:MAG TPA: Mor transcription activator family protein [Candidatus Gastranaerophilales bacterium]|nr:Mor transcription activator family protein [Candidatus Gastranaerophilales bacterium]